MPANGLPSPKNKPMQILLTAATPFEIAPALRWLEKSFPQPENGVFKKENLEVFPLISGVGMMATGWRLGLFLAQNRPDLALNAGIAGAFDSSFRIGDVCNVTAEQFGDLGVEEADGSFTDLFELGLAEAGEAAWAKDVLLNPANEQFAFLPAARGLTVNKVHGAASSIAAIRMKYPGAQVETMEGAAFFYACLNAGIPFLEIRSISNFVEPRNREAWDLPLAIDNLNQTLIGMLESF